MQVFRVFFTLNSGCVFSSPSTALRFSGTIWILLLSLPVGRLVSYRELLDKPCVSDKDLRFTSLQGAGILQWDLPPNE